MWTPKSTTWNSTSRELAVMATRQKEVRGSRQVEAVGREGQRQVYFNVSIPQGWLAEVPELDSEE